MNQEVKDAYSEEIAERIKQSSDNLDGLLLAKEFMKQKVKKK